MKYFILLLIFLPFFSWGSGTSVGTRGGGNIILDEFFEIAQETLGVLSIFKNNRSPVLETLNSRLPEVKVLISSEPLYLDGSHVMAINDPDHMTIEIDENVWIKNLNLEEKRKLVIHELLGVSKQPDSMYNTSREIIANYNKYKTLTVSSLFKYLDKNTSFFMSFNRDIKTVPGLDSSLRYLQMNYFSSSLYAEEYCVAVFHSMPPANILTKSTHNQIYDMIDSRLSLNGKAMAGLYIFLDGKTIQCLTKKEERTEMTIKDFYHLTKDHIEFSMESH